MESINQRIKELRHQLGLSQVKFANAISISKGYLAGIELGDRNVNDRIIRLISVTFSVRESWLKTGEGTVFLEQPTVALDLATSAFRELKPAYQDFILNQISQLYEIQKNE